MASGGVDSQLSDAVARGDAAAIKRLVAAGATPNAFEGEEGWTPLQCAAYSGNTTAMAALLEAGAGVDACDITGTTPLMVATDARHQAAVTVLLDAGADVYRQMDNDGNTALHYACMIAHPRIVGVLLDAGARVDVCNLDGDPPIREVGAPPARSSQPD
jgi:uncharacterized protein